jgi:hypothetical protein
MKATRFMMMFVAAAAMMFASCGKDNNEGNSSNIPQTDIANNTLVYDGVTYQMEPLPAGNAPSSASKDSIDGEPLFFFDGYHFRDGSMRNKTINLAALSEGEEYSISIQKQLYFYILAHHQNRKDNLQYDINIKILKDKSDKRYGRPVC